MAWHGMVNHAIDAIEIADIGFQKKTVTFARRITRGI